MGGGGGGSCEGEAGVWAGGGKGGWVGERGGGGRYAPTPPLAVTWPGRGRGGEGWKGGTPAATRDSAAPLAATWLHGRPRDRFTRAGSVKDAAATKVHRRPGTKAAAAVQGPGAPCAEVGYTAACRARREMAPGPRTRGEGA